MTDTATQKPLKVLDGGIAPPYIRVPYSQLAELSKLLDKHCIRHRPDENVMSFNGGPEIAIVGLTRGADRDSVQAILDSVHESQDLP